MHKADGPKGQTLLELQDILQLVFQLENQGYIGTGNDGSFKKHFWEYDTITTSV